VKRLLWTGGSSFEHGEAPKPASPKRNEVLIRTTAVGICGTDIHIIEGRLPLARPPRVLGHEIAGVVEAVGSGVEKIRVGDRVTVDQVIGCGKCIFCLRGSRQFCRNGFELGITADGGCQTFLVVPQENAFVIPSTISDEVAAILDMEVWAALSKCGIKSGESVLVLGDGPAGMVACQVARVLGAELVMLAGPSGARMRKAQDLSLADRYIFTDQEDVVASVHRAAEGIGATVAVECSGAPEALQNALAAVMPGGRVVLYGLQAAPVQSFDLDTIVLRDLVVFGALSDRNGWERVIELVSNGDLQLDAIITHRFSFKDGPYAYDFVRQRADGLVKAVILL
jgi:2-desacetyl-2-hydroxyethyl bacteriochlorophyllide A dehydrogenase